MTDPLEQNLRRLKLPFILENHQNLAQKAAQLQWPHVQYLAELMEGEAALRQDRSIQRRIRLARFPVIKTLDQFSWSWPKKINRLQIQNLFRLQFIHDKSNAIFLGGVGLGKTHLASALGYAACLQGIPVLFATAIDLSACHAQAGKAGADLLFQIISLRYEQGAMIITSNRAFKDWSEIFNNDATLTSAILDRLLHHAEPVLIEGKSYRMKDRIET